MIAIIAGTGSLPMAACKTLLEQQKPFFVLSLFPEDNFEQLSNLCATRAKVLPCQVFKLGQTLQLLQQEQTTHALMIGKVDKKNMFKKMKFDWTTLQYLGSLLSNSDKSIMDKAVSILESHNIKVIHQTDVLGALRVQPGILTGTMTSELEATINFGMQAARKASECDIGQTVIVKDMMIIAIEAIEGTDLCIKRSIELAHNNVIICKAVRSDHSIQYDLPTLGLKTLEPLSKGMVQAIAWQSDKTFIADIDAFTKRAEELGITLISV